MKKLPNTFVKYIIIASNQHSHNIRGSKYKTIPKTNNSAAYGLNLIKHRAASDWNEVTKQINTLDDGSFVSRTKFAKSYKENILSSYKVELSQMAFHMHKIMYHISFSIIN